MPPREKIQEEVKKEIATVLPSVTSSTLPHPLLISIMPKSDRDILAKYLPEKSVDAVLHLITEHAINLNIKNKRTTKYGDFRPPRKVLPARISINADLNIYAFLITLIHEIAHWFVWSNYKNHKRLQPHGMEWKRTFKSLMSSFLNPEIFPNDLLDILRKHMGNPKATTASDIRLITALRKFDDTQSPLTLLDLNIGQSFILKEREFKILEKKRTRFVCQQSTNKKLYLISGIAEITPI